MESDKKNGKINPDLKEIESVYNLMLHSNLSEINLEEPNCKIKIKRQFGKKIEQTGKLVENNNFLPILSANEPAIEEEEKEKEKEITESIKTPVAGVFYDSPSPGSDLFVSENSVIEKGETVCIIEAMKVMNEIHAEKKCKVIKKLVTNGATVQQGEELFSIIFL